MCSSVISFSANCAEWKGTQYAQWIAEAAPNAIKALAHVESFVSLITQLRGGFRSELYEGQATDYGDSTQQPVSGSGGRPGSNRRPMVHGVQYPECRFIT
jgi:hypothetical protein